MKCIRQYVAISISLIILLTGSLVHVFAGYSYQTTSGHAWGCDDAYISYRYAQNFAMGKGLVYNPGERVEGYSNLLYVLMITPVFLVAGKNSAYPFSVAINLIFGVSALLVFYRFVKRRCGEIEAQIAALLFALCLPIWAAVASGMETALVLLIQILLWISAVTVIEENNTNSIAILMISIATSILARADGFIMPIIVIVLLIIRGKIKVAIYSGMTIIIFMSTYLMWRHDYYGFLLPNTYYVKVSGPFLGRFWIGFKTLLYVFVTEGLLVYLQMIFFRFGSETKKLNFRIPSSFHQIDPDIFIGIGWIAYWLYIGGDNFGERFLLILFPLGIMIFLKHFLPLAIGKVRWITIGILAVIQLTPLYGDARFHYVPSKYDCWIELGNFLGRGDESKVLAIDAAGKVPYFSGLKTIDMLGLNDLYIAHKSIDSFHQTGHNKFDPDYIFAKKPDYICSWISDDFNLFWGLSRNKYLSEGYRLKYLVNSTRSPHDPNIIDISSLSQDSLYCLIQSEYNYAVLEKKQDSL